MSKITYENKVSLNVNSDIADVNKCNATDLNEIKQVVNENDDNIGDLTQLETTDKSSIVGAINSIVESGSNANGNYIKYADGTMICTKIISGSTGNELELWANGTYYRDIQNGSWAQEFVELYNTQATNQTLQLWCNIGNVTNTSAGTTRIIRPDNGGSAGQNYDIQLLAIGRWK